MTRVMTTSLQTLLNVDDGPGARFTPTEQRIVRVLALADKHWVSAQRIIGRSWGEHWIDPSDPVMWQDGQHTLRVNCSRLRPKLFGTGWHLENNKRGAYRLVEDG